MINNYLFKLLDSIAVTQNFANIYNIENICEDILEDGREEDFELLKNCICSQYPELKLMLDGVKIRLNSHCEDKYHFNKNKFDSLDLIKQICKINNYPAPLSEKKIKYIGSDTNLVSFIKILIKIIKMI